MASATKETVSTLPVSNDSTAIEVDVDSVVKNSFTVGSAASADSHAITIDNNNNDNSYSNGGGGGSDDPAKRNSIFRMASYRRKTVLEFRDISYTVGEKQILKGVSGFAEPGHMLAIIGSSGAGKTTLLNMLAGRLSASGNGVAKGEVLVDGKKRDYATFRTTSAYVEQEDVFFAELTVRETISLAALLRLPNSMTTSMKEDRVEQVINELGLKHVANSKVGGQMVRGISGGEKKRLNIATELVTDPSLLFLDEPTTGLDSFTAQNIIATIMRLAQNGRTIIATIHQPRSSIFQMFDSLLLLSAGQNMYFGDAKLAMPYFGKLGYVCPPSFNPSDFFIDLISLDTRNEGNERETRSRVDFLAEQYMDYRRKNPIEPENSNMRSSVPAIASGNPDDVESGAVANNNNTNDNNNNNNNNYSYNNEEIETYATPFWTQFSLLSRRAMQNVMRQKSINMVMFVRNVVFGLLLGVIWLRTGDMHSADEVRGIVGALFFFLINASFSAVFGVLFVFPHERAVVQKERASRTYRVSAYFLSKQLSELPRSLLFSLLFLAISYYMVGFRPQFQYFMALWGITTLTMLCAEGTAYLLSAGAKNMQQAMAMVPAMLVATMLFAGFFVNKSLIPVWLSWLSYLSFVRYGFMLAVQSQFMGRSLDVTCSLQSASGFCPNDGDQVIDEYGLNELDWWVNLIMLFVLAFVFRFLAYVILRRGGPKFDTSL